MKYFLFKSLLYFILLFTNLYILFILTPTFINDAYNHDMFTYSWQIAVYMFVYYFYRLMTRAMVTINELIVVLKSNIIALVAILVILSCYSLSRWCFQDAKVSPLSGFFLVPG